LAQKQVCIDGFNLALAKGSGIATYARNLGASLKRLGFGTHLLNGPARNPGGLDLLNEVALYEPVLIKPPRPSARQFFLKRVSNLTQEATGVVRTGEVETRQMRSRDFGADVLWSCRDLFHVANRGYAAHGKFTEVRLGAKSEPQPIDAMHWTCVLPLRAPGVANLYTIHDVVPLKLPFATLDDKPRFFEICAKICREADHVVTVSETSKNDIIRLFGIDEARITNTYQAVDLPQALLETDPQELAAEIEGVFNLAWKGYFIFFGAVEPKKNLARIIEAYLASGAPTPLVIVGGRAWLDEDETRLMYDDLIQVQVIKDGVIRRADRIRRYDYLPFETLVGLIRGAKATLFPSLYEGFGLPILESMQLGAPVLASTTGASPEIAGDAAVLVDPYDTRAIKRAIQALDADDALCEDLSRRGRVQAAKFSPSAYEQRLDALYRKLL